MDSNEFRRRGYEMVDYIANYIDTVGDRRVLSDVSPGYLRPLLPESAPEQGESFDKIMEDVEKIIMPGVTHWKSPHFHAYFPATGSYPSYLADMLSGAIGCIGFSWINSPACTELETVMMDWLAKACGLPEQFWSIDSKGNPTQGGGVIQGTASEATLVSMLAARTDAIVRLRAEDPSLSLADALGKLVAYTSEQSHNSVHKGSVMAAVHLRNVPYTSTFEMNVDALEVLIQEDKDAGRVPFWVCATVGTTSSCAVDDVPRIGALCKAQGLWLHVDGAYAGSATICPEFRDLIKGLEYADSYTFNPHKWLLTHFDCCALWVKNRHVLTNTFKMDAAYLKNKATESGLVLDYKDWQIPLGRRFRSLKLWFVLRCYGIEGLQAHIRKHVSLAKEFLALVEKDDRYEIVAPPMLGLVCFRLKADNDTNKRLNDAITAEGRIFISPTVLGGTFTLRFVLCSPATESSHVTTAWETIQKHAAALQ
eukprot:comp23463_c1_seq1/m.39189 comp23463_c1_seq1/g.39189  ORF comp23463_c1_seq1/g.39189 comp23463_c1_seq1/m.39189 type:complete len:480 (-) comp23463_c1_seq1:195-1634(-)